MSKTLARVVCLIGAGVLATLPAAAADATATPQPLVASYQSLADVILGAKQTEWNLVHSILATTYAHAEGLHRSAAGKIAAKQDAKADLENLATLVGQLGNEGDAAVAAVRKRLIDGGHHHHADDGEPASEYDEGFVIVTRAAKKAFLDAANRIGRLAAKPEAGALETAWAAVEAQFKALHPKP